jgi:antirestriction protein ArdC
MAAVEHHSVYSIITEQIVQQLESGVAPWRKPWNIAPPANLVSGRPYRGINTLLLAIRGWGSPWWLTYKQAAERGGHVRRGEHGAKVVFWKCDKYETETPDGATVERTSAILRYYTVFNVEQCEGIGAPQAACTVNPIEECERIIAGMPGKPGFAQDARAWYRPSTDTVGMPARTAFDSAEGYYGTLFHELTHSTGHASRLGREGIEKLEQFGSESYSREELVAEIGSAMLCGIAGIAPQTVANSASYLQSWLRVLRADARMVISAASAAQKAADYILGRTP